MEALGLSFSIFSSNFRKDVNKHSTESHFQCSIRTPPAGRKDRWGGAAAGPACGLARRRLLPTCRAKFSGWLAVISKTHQNSLATSKDQWHRPPTIIPICSSTCIFWMPNCFTSGNFHPVPQVPQRRSTGLESPVEEVSLFINNLPTYGACQHRTPKLFVQGTANFPFRGQHPEKII